jgi:hypothetical protein
MPVASIILRSRSPAIPWDDCGGPWAYQFSLDHRVRQLPGTDLSMTKNDKKPAGYSGHQILPRDRRDRGWCHSSRNGIILAIGPAVDLIRENPDATLKGSDDHIIQKVSPPESQPGLAIVSLSPGEYNEKTHVNHKLAGTVQCRCLPNSS